MAYQKQTFQKKTAESSGEKALDDNVVKIYRCSKVVKGGRRFSFGSLIVVGDRNGRVGIGYGKAGEVPSSVEKAKKIASKNLKNVKRKGSTIPHRTVGRHCASQVVLIPASKGTGVIAGGSVRAVLELAGIRDVLTKSYGSNTPKNLVMATFNALTSFLDREQVSRLRGVSLGRSSDGADGNT